MPDKRKHRGPHPVDAELFAADQHAQLRAAVADLSWLWTHGYSSSASLKLVGDRYRLAERQRRAVMRSSCSDDALQRRYSTRLSAAELADCELEIDGFNLLTTIEAALAGGVILTGRDGCFRDMASMHGSYRKVAETRPALQQIGESLGVLHVGRCRWLFDRPVSNSGRVSKLVCELAAEHRWRWEADLADDPDELLIRSDRVVVSADGGVIDRCARWFDLAGHVVRNIPGANIVEMSPSN